MRIESINFLSHRDLTADLLKSTGFQDPILVKPGASVARTREVGLHNIRLHSLCSSSVVLPLHHTLLHAVNHYHHK